MASILVLAVSVAVFTAIFGVVILQSLAPINDEIILSPLKQKCQLIANEGYKIHWMYPDSSPEELPKEDMKRLLYLDERWMKECVAGLPAETVFEIVNSVERDFLHGE